MNFLAHDLSLQLVAQLAAPADAIARRDRELARQLRTAASSVPLNLAEGWWREGADKRYRYRIAAGSAEETRTALRTAVAWGYVDAGRVEEPLAMLDRLARMLYSLTR